MEPTLAGQRIDVRPATPTIGAEVRGVDLATAPDDDDLMRAIGELLNEHLVLFFRDQHELTDDGQIRFAGWFGPFEYHAFAKPHPDHPEMTVLDQVTPERDGANSWHSDSSFMETPALGSVLRAIQLPPLGGDTCWASMYAAWTTLPWTSKTRASAGTAVDPAGPTASITPPRTTTAPGSTTWPGETITRPPVRAKAARSAPGASAAAIGIASRTVSADART